MHARHAKLLVVLVTVVRMVQICSEVFSVMLNWEVPKTVFCGVNRVRRRVFKISANSFLNDRLTLQNSWIIDATSTRKNKSWFKLENTVHVPLLNYIYTFTTQISVSHSFLCSRLDGVDSQLHAPAPLLRVDSVLNNGYRTPKWVPARGRALPVRPGMGKTI